MGAVLNLKVGINNMYFAFTLEENKYSKSNYDRDPRRDEKRREEKRRSRIQVSVSARKCGGIPNYGNNQSVRKLIISDYLTNLLRHI